MRLLMRARGGTPSRLAIAAAGLAARGHRVRWSGPAPVDVPASVVRVHDWREIAHERVDAVLGDSGSVAGTALAGALARARVLALALEPATVAHWGALDRVAWAAMYGVGLIVPGDAAAFVAAAPHVAADRVGLWPDGPGAAAVDAIHPDTEILERALERALARQRGHAPRAALFVDRDGTLVREVGYLSDAERLELLPGVVEAIRAARQADVPVIVVSNQSGVGRGRFTLARAYEVMAALRGQLRVHGIELDAIYLCPHRPDEDCPCRKPRPGLLLRAVEDQLLSRVGSVMVGDKRIDAETGQRLGGAGVLVRTGYGREEEAAIDPAGRGPDAVVDDLPGAVRWMLTRSDRETTR